MDNDNNKCQYPLSNGKKCPHPIEEKYEDNKYCVFHSHNISKKDIFPHRISDEIVKVNNRISSIKDQTSLSPDQKKEKIANEIIDFEGFYFPDGFQFNRNRQDNNLISILAKITFKNAIFNSDVNFSNFSFKNDVDFSNTTFKGKADFSHTAFDGESLIFQSIYNNEVDFSETLFNNGIPDFSHIHFPNQISFHKTHFYKGVYFSNVTFEGYANFHFSQFHAKTEFANSTFQKEANFIDAKFYSPVYFNDTSFLNVTNTDDEICCSFLRAIFKETAGFNNVIFKGNANFIETHFLHIAEFNGSQFLNKAIFKEAEFLKNGLEAKGSIFFGEADFSDSNFDEEANFGEVLFLGEKVNFTRLKCTALSLRNCTFLSDIIDLGPYLSTSFNYFEGINFIGRADFTAKNCENYRFLNCLMIGCSFLKSDIVNTIFINCSWDFSDVDDVLKKQRKILENLRNLNELLNKYQVIENKYKEYIKIAKKKKSNTLDEVLFWKEKNIELGEIQECCMQLKNNRDKAKDYLTANNFYQSEMEMIRTKEGAKLKEKYDLFLKEQGISEKGKIQFQIRMIFFIILLFLSIAAFIYFYPKTFPNVCIVLFIILSSILAFTIGKYSFFTIYKILSGYGNKPLYAVALFLIILIIFSALIVVLDGVKNIDSLDSTNKTYKKMNFYEKFYYVSMWNLANPFTPQNKQFQPKGISAHFPVFIFQYLYRPLMIALIIFAIKRKVQR